MKKSFISILIALSLMILAAGAVFAASPARGSELRVDGSVQSLENDEVNYPIIYLHGNGSGSTTGLGQITYHFEGIVSNDANGVGIAVEGMHFTAANGDILFATGTGLGAPSQTQGDNKIVEKYTITGGTGRFLGASGNLTVTRLVTLSTSNSTGTIKGNVELK